MYYVYLSVYRYNCILAMCAYCIRLTGNIGELQKEQTGAYVHIHTYAGAYMINMMV
jgi:hypothetical protein